MEQNYLAISFPYHKGKAIYWKKILQKCYCLHWYYPYMSISECNKCDEWWRNYIKRQWVFCRYYWYRESVEQNRKRECLKYAINKGKLLDGQKQWRHEGVDKTSDEIINKVYAKYKKRELNEKGEKAGNF